jgi:hypothetical protein
LAHFGAALAVRLRCWSAPSVVMVLLLLAIPIALLAPYACAAPTTTPTGGTTPPDLHRVGNKLLDRSTGKVVHLKGTYITSQTDTPAEEIGC